MYKIADLCVFYPNILYKDKHIDSFVDMVDTLQMIQTNMAKIVPLFSGDDAHITFFVKIFFLVIILKMILDIIDLN